MKITINDTFFGRANKKILSKIEPMLLKLYTTTDYDLTFGYKNVNNGEICFITGRSPLEDKLPVFTFPLNIKSLSGKDIIFIDVRNVIKNNITDNIFDSVRDEVYLKSSIIQATYILKYLNTNIEAANLSFKTVLRAISGWLTSQIAFDFTLNVNEKLDLNIAMVDLIIKLWGMKYDTKMRHFLASTLVTEGRVTEDYVTDILGKDEYELNSLEDFINKLKEFNISTKLEHINTLVLSNILKTNVFGFGMSEKAVLSIEHPPSAYALIYIAYDNRLLHRTKLGVYLNRNKRILDLDHYVKVVENELTSYNVSLEDDTNKVIEEETQDTTLMYDDGLFKLFHITNNKQGNMYRLYIGDFMSDDISELLETLKSIKDTKEIELVINSNGGYVYLGFQLYNVLFDVFGDNIITVMNATGKSMGAMTFCIGKKRIVYPYSNIMFHTYSGMALGKTQEMRSQLENSEKVLLPFFKKYTVGRGFFTEEEYEALINGKDFWFSPIEMLERNIATHIRINGRDIPRDEYLKSIK